MSQQEEEERKTGTAGVGEQHPYAEKWVQPQELRPELVVYNTLTRTKVPFRPHDGNNVYWYNCGPTVYDASHIGHARNYVTFDIIRRILEDYFNYDVTLVMNITDIDDKIILRARQGHLVNQYLKSNPIITESLLLELRGMWKDFITAKFDCINLKEEVEEAWKMLQAKYKSLTEEKAVGEVEAKKLMQFKVAAKALNALECAQVGSLSKELLDSFQDILAGELDLKHGATVTDQRIFRELAAHWEGEFFKDLKALNVRPVSLVTRVTEFVPHIIEYIQKIIKNGYAYESQGSVYFDVSNFGEKGHLYAKLCPWSAGNCKFFEEGEGSLGVKLGGKNDPRDFALWKASKVGEPQWESPWGLGRPGWHIECSAMAAAVVPSQLDIHSGGIDLAFPHHDNEIAQSEAFYETSQWVNYFLHAGHVHIEGHKMSKSLKNFITIQEALEKYTSRQLRIMFLQHQWNSPVFYKEASMITAISIETLFINFFNNIIAHLRANSMGVKVVPPACSVGVPEMDLLDLLSKVRSKVHLLLCDNFDTPGVLSQLQELVNHTNIYLQMQTLPNSYILEMVGRYVTKILRTFGVVQTGDKEDMIGFPEPSSGGTGQDLWDTIGPILETISEYRDEVRGIALQKEDKELLSISDKVRERLMESGVIFEDRPGRATLVKLVDKETIVKMRREQETRDEEKLARKLEMIRINEEKRNEKLRKAAIDPKTMFLGNPSFSKFDDQSIPTHDGDGAELSKSLRKKFLKEFEIQVELHEKYLNGKL